MLDKRTIVFVNPTAGSGRAATVWRQLAGELRGAHVIDAADAEDARGALDEALHRETDRIVAVGGDGTLHLVVQQLLGLGVGDRVALGLVPAGTGSDLARTLEIPRQPRAALAAALAAVPRPIDAIAADPDDGPRRYAVNIASAGFSGQVARAVDARPKRGSWAYLRATLATLGRYRPRPCRLSTDGIVIHDGPFFMAAIANGRYFGNGMPVAPRAEIDDGLLDIVVAGPLPRWQMPYRLPQFLLGRHLETSFVRYQRGRSLRLDAGAGQLAFELDGEPLAARSLSFSVLPGALRVLSRT